MKTVSAFQANKGVGLMIDTAFAEAVLMEERWRGLVTVIPIGE
ncbi:hypothetical protein [Dyella humicola]|nr:hypothetical protein [Dyella humicola]